MKIVFDTNVYVAEALGGDTACRILASTERASWRIYISPYIVDELMTVMAEDLGFPRRSATLAAVRSLRRGRLVEPIPSRHGVAEDTADSDVLRTALRAGADYLITNDRHLLALGPYEGVRIITMAEYREMLEDQALFH
jgi:putative PIN family toxin of toxin-antitoxin system